MTVVAMWKCDRDDSMFDNKKEADAYDKMLMLAEHFAAFLEKHAEGISEQDAENIGLLLSKNKDQLVAACKGKPELLIAIGSDTETEEEPKVASLVTNA
ncbi:MAG: YebG family protein [Gammaproteobacteria bacterium]|nr:YebG family protein [Gammaproteobacteria bacterium]